MFKFLAFFRKSNNEQLSDNDYDFNEIPVSENDIKGRSENEGLATVSDLAEKRKQKEEKNNNPLVPDLSLIHGYGHPEDENEEIPIGVTRFRKGDKILEFVAVEHTGKVHDRTHRTIREAITAPKPQVRHVRHLHNARQGKVAGAITPGGPQVVITEGHATDMPKDVKKGIIEWTKKEVEKVKDNNDVQDEKTNIPEAGYAAYLADEQGVETVGGEISGNEFLAKMQEHGYSAEDVLAVQFMRQLETIPPDDRATMTEEEFFENHAKKLLDEANQIVNPQQLATIEPLTLDRFKEWYDTLRPLGDRSFLTVGHEDFVPRQEGEYLNKMACVSGLVRDEHIAELLGTLLNQNDRVTIVYGSGHLSSLRPVLVDMFDDEGTVVNVDSPQQQAA